jgi:hypothetical protein
MEEIGAACAATMAVTVTRAPAAFATGAFSNLRKRRFDQ